MRPSTIDAPSVPALKLTKPSCITVVPSARCAPSRTRSASAMRTPAARRSRHAGELVHDVTVSGRPAARKRRRTAASVAGSIGPCVVHATLGSDAEDPVRSPRAAGSAGWRAGGGAGRRPGVLGRLREQSITVRTGMMRTPRRSSRRAAAEIGRRGVDAELPCAGPPGAVGAPQHGRRVPGVQHPSGLRHGGETVAPGALVDRCGHGPDGSGGARITPAAGSPPGPGRARGARISSGGTRSVERRSRRARRSAPMSRAGARRGGGGAQRPRRGRRVLRRAPRRTARSAPR